MTTTKDRILGERGEVTEEWRKSRDRFTRKGSLHCGGVDLCKRENSDRVGEWTRRRKVLRTWWNVPEYMSLTN